MAVLLVTLALLATTTAVAGAQRPSSGLDGSTAGDAGPQTCAELGLPVVEPISVSWEASWEPARNPNYLWAYGDVDDLWDDSLNEYWYHWYGAVPGPDPHVEYRFERGTTIEAVQFHTNWSSGNLLLAGLDGFGQPVSDVTVVPLTEPFVWHAERFAPMTVSAMKLTTSTQNVKLHEVDFCGEGEPELGALDLTVSVPACESVAAAWTPQPGADHRIDIVDSANSPVVSQGGLVDGYGPASIPPGSYTATVTANSAAGSISETETVTIPECSVQTGCGPDHDPADRYCDSLNVIESFGDAPLPPGEGAGHQWHTIDEYYNSFGDRPGMCTIDIHNSYWTAVRSDAGDLDYYPSWHPPIHDEGGSEECRFTHEHGLDPTGSDLYDEDHPTNIGAPFGFVHPGGGNVPGRVEDHVGHKIVVENDLQLTTNNPYGAGIMLNLFQLNGQPVTCDWYSKLHQGTHGPDALGFNLHEYYLNYSCDDGTEVRVKEMTDFGFKTPNMAAGPNQALNGGSGTVASDCGWFATNHPAPASDPDPSSDSDFGDAKRGFTCLMNDAKIEELWKASAYLSAPNGAATVAYDPYYLVMNSNRFALYRWWDYLEQDGDHVGEDAMLSMVDFCVAGSELRNELSRPAAPGNFVKAGANYGGQFRVSTYCDSIDPSVRAGWAADIVNAGGDSEALAAERKLSVDNVFVGTRRGVHVKGPVVYGGSPNFGSLVLFCSDHLGNGSAWPVNPDTGGAVTAASPWQPGDPTPACSGAVPQLLSTFNNGHGPVEGSTAGATVTGGGLQSNGPANEIIIDIDALYPGHGIQAPN